MNLIEAQVQLLLFFYTLHFNPIITSRSSMVHRISCQEAGEHYNKKEVNGSSLARHELVAGAAKLHGKNVTDTSQLHGNKYQTGLLRVIYGLLIKCGISSELFFVFSVCPRHDLVQSYVSCPAGATVFTNY